MIAIDTETFLIKGGNTPPLVCMSYAVQGPQGVRCGVATGRDVRVVLEGALKSPMPLVLHNASFDFTVLMRAFPDLAPALFEALGKGRVHDTKVRERLHKIAQGGTGDGAEITASGGRVGKLSLAGLTWKYLGLDLSAKKQEGAVRYHYDELASKSADTWPREAVDYAALDALTTLMVFRAQEADIPAEELVDEFPQVRADFALALMAQEGVLVDQDAIGGVEDALTELVEQERAALVDAGILRPAGTVDTDAVKGIVERAYVAQGREVPKTDKGEVSCAKDALEGTEDPRLVRLVAYKEALKLRDTYVPSLRAAAHMDGRLRTSYQSLMQTGRTSSKEPNLQNLPRKGGLRDCFVPSAGHVLVLCDYAAAEMRTLAQCVLDMCGKRTPLLDMYQERPDYDPHAHFGGFLLGLTYDEMRERLRAGDKEAKAMRQRAKPANFGYAGGMGAQTFIAYAAQYGVALTLDEAQELKDKWVQLYEMRPWFNEADRAAKGDGVVVPRSLRKRGRVNYTQACNTPFQGLAADFAKLALFETCRECYTVPSSPLYGCRPLVFIHDEIILDAPEERGHEAAMRLKEIMEAAQAYYCPDVPPCAEPALARRWLKDAEPVWVDGRLVPWEPRP
jgi:DNA polymerase I